MRCEDCGAQHRISTRHYGEWCEARRRRYIDRQEKWNASHPIARALASVKDHQKRRQG